MLAIPGMWFTFYHLCSYNPTSRVIQIIQNSFAIVTNSDFERLAK